VPLTNMMHQEIASVINEVHFHQQAPAHMRIMNTRMNAKGVIIAVMHWNTTTEIAMRYHNIIITAAMTVDRGVVDVEENDTCERLMIHGETRVQYLGKGTEGL